MVVIRLARGGSKKRPFYNIVVADSRERRDGRFIEKLGFYNPVASEGEEALRVAQDRVTYWLGVGAQASETASRLMGCDQAFPPEIDLDEKARADATAVIGTDLAPILAFAPISTAQDRSWPANRWAALVQKLMADPGFAGWRFMAVGGPSDHQAAAPALAAAGARGIDFVGQGDILAAAAALQRADLFVGNDSGLMHVSA
ncbi:MAG: 30S ribosomal protein S16, partial [Burkholderiales bacterium]|nr:30S ribosomal protein S16 [Burkholderiales bacterium]